MKRMNAAPKYRTAIDFLLKLVFLAIVVVVLAGFTGGLLLIHAASRGLREQSSFHMGHIKVVFKRGEYENVSTATAWYGTCEMRDVNKSRIIGEWTAEKSKEFSKGVFDGLRKGPKHE